MYRRTKTVPRAFNSKAAKREQTPHEHHESKRIPSRASGERRPTFWHAEACCFRCRRRRPIAVARASRTLRGNPFSLTLAPFSLVHRVWRIDAERLRNVFGVGEPTLPLAAGDRSEVGVAVGVGGDTG